jgi:hypothetical protein
MDFVFPLEESRGFCHERFQERKEFGSREEIPALDDDFFSIEGNYETIAFTDSNQCVVTKIMVIDGVIF